MGIIFKTRTFSELSADVSLRCDFNFINNLSPLTDAFYSYRSLFEIIEPSKPNIDELESFQYAEIGNVSKTGEVSPVCLSFSDRHEENESLFKKIEKGDNAVLNFLVGKQEWLCYVLLACQNRARMRCGRLPDAGGEYVRPDSQG